MRKYLIGIDVGTSGTKVCLFDTDGALIASATEEYPMYQPHNGWAEQNPDDFLTATRAALRRVCTSADGEIVGVGLSGQMHSLVMLDERDEVIRPAILWCDQRTSAECAELTAALGEETLVRLSGNTAMPAFTASKLMWVRKHEPDNFARCRRIMLAKDYVRLYLTGAYATDAADASGTQLFDVNTRAWSAELCAAAGVDISILPRVYESYECAGYVSESAAEETALPLGIPVAAGAGDNAAAAVGVGACAVGDAFTTVGTSGVVYAPTDIPVADSLGRFNCFCDATGAWHVLGITQSAGLSMSWFAKALARDKSYKEIDIMASESPIGAKRLVYLPYLMGERTPILDPNARGVFIGLSPIHTLGDMARSVMEGVSYSLYDCYSAISASGVRMGGMSICGGGAKSALWREMLTDVYGLPTYTPISSESASLGAAILGGCAAGIYPDVRAGVGACVKRSEEKLPNAEHHDRYMRFFDFYKSMYPALKDSFKALSEL